MTCALRSCAGNSAITVRVVVRCSFVGTPPDYYQRGSCVADVDRCSAYITSPLGYLICDEFVHAVLSIDVRARVFLLFFDATYTLKEPPCHCRSVYCVGLLFLLVCCFPSVPPKTRKSTQLYSLLCYACACAKPTGENSDTLEYPAAHQVLTLTHMLLRCVLLEFSIR